MRLKSTFYLFLVATILFQGCGIKSRIKKANKRYDIGEYNAAGDVFKSIYSNLTSKQKPLKAEIAYKQAECYRLTNQGRAEQTYLNAIRYNYPDSIVYLRYAEVLQQNGKYSEAAKNYEIYLQKDSSNVVAKNGVIACKSVAGWIKVPTRYVAKRSAEFNLRRTSNFSPAFVGSTGDMVVFTSSRPQNKTSVQKKSAITGLPTYDLFSTRKNAAGKWETPEPLEGEINTINDEGACSFTDDGKIIYFTRSPYVPDGAKGTDILSSNRAGGSWSLPQKIKIFKDRSEERRVGK